MKSHISRRVVAASLMLGVSPLAFAQDAPETLDTVIVTGVGPQRDTDEMVGNVTAINRGEIIEKLSGTLGYTLAGEAGVSTTFFGQGASRPVLRGLGAERVLVLTNGIGALDASAASPDHQVATDGIDAEKIEILRGPAALAYGGQAIGGVVNVIDGLIVESLPDEPVSFEGFAANDSVNEGTEAGGKARFATGPLVLTLSASARDFGDYDMPGFAESSAARAASRGLAKTHSSASPCVSKCRAMASQATNMMSMRKKSTTMRTMRKRKATRKNPRLSIWNRPVMIFGVARSWMRAL